MYYNYRCKTHVYSTPLVLYIWENVANVLLCRVRVCLILPLLSFLSPFSSSFPFLPSPSLLPPSFLPLPSFPSLLSPPPSLSFPSSLSSQIIVTGTLYMYIIHTETHLLISPEIHSVMILLSLPSIPTPFLPLPLPYLPSPDHSTHMTHSLTY